MRVYLPQPHPVYDTQQMYAAQEALIRALVPAVSQDEAIPYLHLLAPNGGVWRVTVTDAGLLATVKVQG
jgi:hypothetical protein